MDRTKKRPNPVHRVLSSFAIFGVAGIALTASLTLVSGCSHNSDVPPVAAGTAGAPANNAPAQQAQAQMMAGRAADAAKNAAAMKAAGKK